MGDFGDGRLLSWPGAPMILSEAKCRFCVGITGSTDWSDTSIYFNLLRFQWSNQLKMRFFGIYDPRSNSKCGDSILLLENHTFFKNRTLWLFNIAMENGPFIDDFPIKTSIYQGFSMAMSVITRGYMFPRVSGKFSRNSRRTFPSAANLRGPTRSPRTHLGRFGICSSGKFDRRTIHLGKFHHDLTATEPWNHG